MVLINSLSSLFLTIMKEMINQNSRIYPKNVSGRSCFGWLIIGTCCQRRKRAAELSRNWALNNVYGNVFVVFISRRYKSVSHSVKYRKKEKNLLWMWRSTRTIAVAERPILIWILDAVPSVVTMQILLNRKRFSLYTHRQKKKFLFLD